MNCLNLQLVIITLQMMLIVFVKIKMVTAIFWYPSLDYPIRKPTIAMKEKPVVTLFL
uniref:Uncharacterized protein n=1 Tax=Arundo donax TaxID=35708 RepID=A0A0A9DJD3_ARUDO